MKKILISTIIASAFLFSACEDNLDIAQKGVITDETFFQTDEDVEQSRVALYQGLQWNIASQNGAFTYNPFYFCMNLCADDLFSAGENINDNQFSPEMNEFRLSSANDVITKAYQSIYYALYYCNLSIDKYKDGLPNVGQTDATKRLVAEARVMRAMLYFYLASGWGQPPHVTHVLNATDYPSNYEGSQADLIAWCAQECEEACGDLDKRSDPSDKAGAAKITQGFANALAGKCYVSIGEWAKAKTALKKVIDSKAYDLVSGDRFWENFHKEGDLNEEKIFESNFVMDFATVDFGTAMNHTNWMMSEIWCWRSSRFTLSPVEAYTGTEGWGGLGVPKAFADKFVENDGLDSYRLKTSIIPVEDLVYGRVANYGDNVASKSVETLEKDATIGIKSDGLYGQSLYLPYKTIVKASDCVFGNMSEKNFTFMRYAEVLLLYAEACIQSGDAGEALTYINMIQKRAGSKTISTSADMNVLKTEKQLELWLEGCRWFDMLRWNDLEVAKTAGNKVTSVFDKLTRPIASGDEVTEEHSRFYSIYASEAKGRQVGFQEGKHNLFPYPSIVVENNPNLKQNPGW